MLGDGHVRFGGRARPRVANQQCYTGPYVAQSQLQLGDLVFYATNLADPATIHHVGMYIGHGQMIDAPYTGAVIRLTPSTSPAASAQCIRPANAC